MSVVTDILRVIVPTRDEAFSIAATIVSRLFESPQDAANARRGLAIARAAMEYEDRPEEYLDGLLDKTEAQAQKRARDRFGG